MAHMIIPIFIMYKGCPNRCSYCNERITAGDYTDRISPAQFRTVIDRYLAHAKNTETIQIAFYGGNFTGIDEDYQRELLENAESYIRDNRVDSIRLSTRPDYIDTRKVKILEEYSVRTVEIGAQSMVDDVLAQSRRGHSSDDVRNAVMLLKDRGFETGVHLMVGLPSDSDERFRYTVEEIITLRPDMVRIHPTIVFRGTELATRYEEGKYHPLATDDAITLCKDAVRKFETAGIPVIRLGLQMTHEMEAEGAIIAGPHHPAFRSLVESSLFFDMAVHLLRTAGPDDEKITFRVNPKDVSDFRGNRNVNVRALEKCILGDGFTIETNPLQERGLLVMSRGERDYEIDRLSEKL